MWEPGGIIAGLPSGGGKGGTALPFHAFHGRGISMVHCGSSLKVEPNRQRGSTRHGEIKRKLLMRVRVLFAPKHPQQLRPVSAKADSSSHPGMAARAERNHQLQFRATGYPVVDSKRALPPAGRVANPAAATVPVEHRFAQAAELLPILPPHCVAGSAHAAHNHVVAAGAVQRPPDPLFHG